MKIRFRKGSNHPAAFILSGLFFLSFMYIFNLFGVFPLRHRNLLGPREDRTIVREEDPERFNGRIALGVGIGVAAVVFGVLGAAGARKGLPPAG